jgi:choline dehydrogenase-like flavoprotein
LRATQIEFTPGESTAKALETHTQNLLKILRAAGCSEASLFHQLIKPDGAHAVSTCRMSGSESDGVVDGDLRVHGTENVFVCSNGVFPNVTAVNPTLTVAALAVRLAEHLTP